jgi:hypothetical protein
LTVQLKRQGAEHRYIPLLVTAPGFGWMVCAGADASAQARAYCGSWGVVDADGAMTHDRSYRRTLSPDRRAPSVGARIRIAVSRGARLGRAGEWPQGRGSRVRREPRGR